MPKQRPMGDEDDEDLMLVEEDEQEGEPEEQADEPAEEPDEGVEHNLDTPDDEDEPEAPRRPQQKRDDRARAAKAREKAIKQRIALRDANAAAESARREAADLRRQLAEREASSAGDTIANIDRDIERLEADLSRAIENGETGAQVKAARALAQLEAKRIVAERDIASRKSAPADEKPQQQTAQEFDLTTLPKHVLSWVARHGYLSWTKEEQALATKLGSELQDEGYDDSDPEYLRELDARLKDYIPHRLNSGIRRNGDPQDLRRPQRRAAPSPSTEERSSLPKVGMKRALTAGEQRHLREMYGGQPSPDQVRAYLRANPTPLSIR